MKTASLNKINMTSQNEQLRKIKKYTRSWSEMNKYKWNRKVSHEGLSSVVLISVGLNSDGNSNDGGRVPSHWGPGHFHEIYSSSHQDEPDVGHPGAFTSSDLCLLRDPWKQVKLNNETTMMAETGAQLNHGEDRPSPS